MPRAIDLHFHPSTSEWVDGAMGEFRSACEHYFHTRLPEHSVDEMAAVFRAADVVGVLLAWDAETHTGNPPVSNDFVASCVAAHPETFLGFASVDPHKPDAVVELERAVRFLGLRGLKVHPGAQGFAPDDRAVYPIWETAQSLDIPVLIHTGTTGLGAGMRGGGGVALRALIGGLVKFRLGFFMHDRVARAEERGQHQAGQGRAGRSAARIAHEPPRCHRQHHRQLLLRSSRRCYRRSRTPLSSRHPVPAGTATWRDTRDYLAYLASSDNQNYLVKVRKVFCLKPRLSGLLRYQPR